MDQRLSALARLARVDLLGGDEHDLVPARRRSFGGARGQLVLAFRVNDSEGDLWAFVPLGRVRVEPDLAEGSTGELQRLPLDQNPPTDRYRLPQLIVVALTPTGCDPAETERHEPG